MKISSAEVAAALMAVREYGESIVQLDALRSALVDALEAAYTVRKQRKAAKRERQEKDKQVVESVKPTSLFAGMFGQADWKADKTAVWGNLEALAGISSAVQSQKEPAPSKAPEWDGTFGVGKDYQTRNNTKVKIVQIGDDFMKGEGKDEAEGTYFLIFNGRGDAGDGYEKFDLIRPWPKPTEGERS